VHYKISWTIKLASTHGFFQECAFDFLYTTFPDVSQKRNSLLVFQNIFTVHQFILKAHLFMMRKFFIGTKNNTFCLETRIIRIRKIWI